MGRRDRGGDGARAGEHPPLVGHADRDPARPCRAQGLDRGALEGRRADRADGAANGWQTVAPSALPSRRARTLRPRSIVAGMAGSRDAFAAAARAGGSAGARRRAAPRRTRLSAAPVPVAALEPARRRIWRHRSRTGCAFRSRSSMRFARAFPADRPVTMRVSGTDWVEGGWDIEQTIAFAQGARGARLRRDPRLERRARSAPEDSRRARAIRCRSRARSSGR